MPSWSEFAAAAPELAGAIEACLAASRYSLLGTMRAGGFPRVSSIVARVADGDLCLTTRADSAIAADLRRDDRCALHSGPVHGFAATGDAKLTTRAEEAAAESAGGARFRLEIVDASKVRLGEPPDHRVIESWRAGETGSRRVVR